MIRTEGFFVAPTSQDEIASSRAQGLRATWEGTTGPIRWIRDIGELGDAWQSGRTDVQLGRGSWMQPADSEAWMQSRGLGGQFTFDRPYAKQELEILERRKRAELRRASILSRADGGALGRFGVSLAASMVDPINVASAFVPIVGEARYARMLQAAGGAAGRAGVRAGAGAIEGLAGAAMLEPLNYAARAQEQADWRTSDSMTNILFGAAFGAALHTGGGALADLFTRRRGMVVADLPEEALAPGGSRLGDMSQVLVGERYAPVQWAVMDASELAPTLEKADNQYRDRNRAAAQAQVREIANNLDFNRLGQSPMMDYGAPTLARDFSAVGGNGRLAAIRMAYETGRADLYREALIDGARQFGVSPEDVKAMTKPVLVRLLREDVDVKKAAIASNEGGAMRMSALEQAKVDAERLGSLDAFHVNEDGNLSLARSRDGIRKWVDEQPATQRAALLSSDGMLSAEGAKRLQNAMLFRAYGDSPTLARLVEATDPGSRNVAAAMVRAAPRMAELRAAAAAGERFDLDISPDLQAAVERLAQIREKGQDVAEALAQGDMLGDGLTREARALVAFMGGNIRSSRAMADLLARYMDAVDALGSPKQAGLFGEVQPPSKATLLRQAADNYEPSAAELVEAAPLEVQRAAMQAGIAQAVQGEAINVEPIIKQDMQGLLDAARRADDPEGKPLNDPMAAQAADEAVAEIPAGDDAAQLAAAEKEIAEAQAVLDETVADLESAGSLGWREFADGKKQMLETSVKIPGNPDGVLQLEIRSGALRVAWADNGLMMPTRSTGSGAFTKAYGQAIQEAQRRGLGFESDSSVTVLAAKVWDRLKAAGHNVEKNPDAVLRKEGDGLPNEPITPRWMTPDDSPVFRLVDKPDPMDAPNFGLPDPPRTLADDHPLLQGHALDDSPARIELRDKIVAKHLEGVEPVKGRKPIAYVMGGGGASGKGTIKTLLRERGEIPDGNAVDIDPDEIKAMLPEYSQIIDLKDSRAAAVTHEESSALAKRVAAEARAKKVDIVLDRTMSDEAKAMAEIAELKAAGYEVRLYGVTLEVGEALKRAVKRAQNKNRWVPMDALLKAHKGFNGVFEKLSAAVDRAVLFDNTGTQPVLLASREAGEDLFIDDAKAYNETRRRSAINEKATTLRELSEGSQAVESARGADAGRVQGGQAQGGKEKAAGAGGLSGKRLDAIREAMPDDLRAQDEAADTMIQDADRMAEIARRASLCALRKGA